MALSEDHPEDQRRTREQLLSKGHNPPRFIDRELPSYEQSIIGIGGPGKPFPRNQGTHPWLAGSFTLGSNKVWHLVDAHFDIGSPNCNFLLRHSHSGTASVPGGTVDAWRFNAVGRTDMIGRADSPLRSIRGPGTISLHGFGGRRNATGSTPYLALASAGSTHFAVVLRGYVT